MLLTKWRRIAFSLSTDANNSDGTTNRHDLTESSYIAIFQHHSVKTLTLFIDFKGALGIANKALRNHFFYFLNVMVMDTASCLKMNGPKRNQKNKQEPMVHVFKTLIFR